MPFLCGKNLLTAGGPSPIDRPDGGPWPDSPWIRRCIYVNVSFSLVVYKQD